MTHEYFEGNARVDSLHLCVTVVTVVTVIVDVTVVTEVAVVALVT